MQCQYRYLSYVMDVATPTADCLNLVYDLLMPVFMKGHSKNTLSHQEVQIKFSNMKHVINCYMVFAVFILHGRLHLLIFQIVFVLY